MSFFFSGSVTCPTFRNEDIALQCSPSQTKHLCLILNAAAHADQNVAQLLAEGAVLLCVTPRVLGKYSRVGKYLNPNPIPKPFRIFFWN